MPHRFLIPWTPLLAVALVTTMGLLRADDPAPSSDGYKTVTVPSANGKSITVRVQQQPDALAHASFPDDLDHKHAFSATNPMANKSFTMPTDGSPTGTTAYKDAKQDGFITKSYNFDGSAPSAPELDRHANVSTNNNFNKNAPGFDKGFDTKANGAQNQAALLASATSSEQGRTANLGTVNTFPTQASAMSGKPFSGEESDALHHTLTRMKNGQMLVTDLPDRPLTIDEVRELINHGFKADTTKPPEESSKPLNDPNYLPEPLRDNPQPQSPAEKTPPRAQPVNPGDDDKFDAVPGPGMMSQPAPENTQPLPQQ